MILNSIGTGLLLLGGLIAVWQYQSLRGQEVAEGKVTALEANRNSKGSTTYRLCAEFRDHLGQPRVYRSSFTCSSPGYGVGDRIRISFHGDNPDNNRILSFGYRFGIAWICILLGAAVFLLPLSFDLGNRWLEHHFPTTVGIPPARE